MTARRCAALLSSAPSSPDACRPTWRRSRSPPEPATVVEAARRPDDRRGQAAGPPPDPALVAMYAPAPTATAPFRRSTSRVPPRAACATRSTSRPARRRGPSSSTPGAVPLPSRARGPRHALRHRHRPRGLRLDRLRHHRPAARWPRWTPPPEMIERDPSLAKWAGGQPAASEPARGAGALHQLRRDHSATGSTDQHPETSAGPLPRAASAC